jgi:hypothetical protein
MYSGDTPGLETQSRRNDAASQIRRHGRAPNPIHGQRLDQRIPAFHSRRSIRDLFRFSVPRLADLFDHLVAYCSPPSFRNSITISFTNSSSISFSMMATSPGAIPAALTSVPVRGNRAFRIFGWDGYLCFDRLGQGQTPVQRTDQRIGQPGQNFPASKG